MYQEFSINSKITYDPITNTIVYKVLCKAAHATTRLVALLITIVIINLMDCDKLWSTLYILKTLLQLCLSMNYVTKIFSYLLNLLT